MTPLVIPVISSSAGIHAAEDQSGISARNFCGINVGISDLCHANPGISVTEEVNCETSVILFPFSVGNKINNKMLGRLIICNSFFKRCITARIRPVIKTIILEVGCLLSVFTIEDDVKTFGSFKLKCNREQAVLTFNCCHSRSGPSIGNRINEPSVKIYFCPLSGIVIKCYLMSDSGFVVTALACLTVFYGSIGFLVLNLVTILMTCCINGNCFLADYVSLANRTVNYDIIASAFSTSRGLFIFLNCLSRCVSKSFAFNCAALRACLRRFAGCIYPFVIITAKTIFASVAPVVSIFVYMTKLGNRLCVCVLRVMRTCVCLNTVLCT